MAICKVIIEGYAGWRLGDHIEASGSRLQELVTHGIVEVVTPDREEKKPEIQKKRGEIL